MNYSLTFGRNSQVIWALVLPAFILLIPMVLAIDYILPLFPEYKNSIIYLVLGYLATYIATTLLSIKLINTRVEITIRDSYLEFILPKKNIFHRYDFQLSFANIINTSEDNDKGYDFLYFECKHPYYKKFYIAAKEGNQNFNSFCKQILSLENKFNKDAPPDKLITNKSIYQRWPMMLLAFIFLALWFIMPVLLYFNKMSWIISLKYWVFIALSFPIVAKVYLQNFYKRKLK